MPEQPGRDAMIERLRRRYAGGGTGMARFLASLRFQRKRWMWTAVVASAHALKRALDLCGGAAGLLALSPVFAVTALAIKIEDGGPVFFSQPRVGRHGREFRMWKFRSMIVDADKLKDTLEAQNEATDVTFKIRRDPRITRVGRVIRKLSVDELPQFFNVLRGDMSLVGPRPPVPREVARYSLDDRVRLEVKPGITCLWQIGGRADLDFRQQVELDKRYIESQTFWSDVKILLKTVPAVLSGKGAY